MSLLMFAAIVLDSVLDNEKVTDEYLTWTGMDRRQQVT